MAPQAQPIVTISEIDEALWWVTITAPRDRHYGRIIDALLDERNRISVGGALLDRPQQDHLTGPSERLTGSQGRAEDHHETRSSR
jgi:hypothetical protein